MFSPLTVSSSPVWGVAKSGVPKISGTDSCHRARSSRLETRGKVSASGPVGQRLPRSSIVTGTPASVSRSAATPPPKPEPMTMTRRSSRSRGTDAAAVPAAVAGPAYALAPAIAPVTADPAMKVRRVSGVAASSRADPGVVEAFLGMGESSETGAVLLPQAVARWRPPPSGGRSRASKTDVSLPWQPGVPPVGRPRPVPASGRKRPGLKGRTRGRRPETAGVMTFGGVR